ncbi:MAG TPA: folylpolyglutamate synthase/dihydrofolate synthase family protein [Vicinamibacterales bacterium]|nr:folylpolyglutamate synthase/dihydrofolate synthase family protein [Vicinamibacterales bacterium]
MIAPLEFLFGLERLGTKLGLESMTRLCDALGHPEHRFRSVIVAGTNGKGSVTAMLASILHAGGHAAARYTSPHLERLEERFVIGEEEVDREALVSAAGLVQRAVDGLIRTRGLDVPPTFFEGATAIAFELFARAAVDLAVLEVGLGGRLDATNVVTPVAAAVTSVDLDHQAQLGTTIEAIAREKAGVIRGGIPVVCGRLPEEADRVIESTCAERGARLVRAADAAWWSCRIDEESTALSISTGRHHLPDVQLALRGRHQADNAAVAVCLAEELARAGVALDESAIEGGLTRARWPGRLERFTWQGADVLIDAAHNPAGARVLADYVREIGWRGATLVAGVVRDKDAGRMLEALAPVCGAVICTTPANPRGLPADELAVLAAAGRFAPGTVEVIAEPEAALRSACRPGARVICAGSIFLIGPLRGILR